LFYATDKGLPNSLTYWFSKTFGVANQGWICPDAQQQHLTQKVISPYEFDDQGSVNSAWQTYDWYNWYWSGIFPGSNPYSTTNRAGSYAGNCWVAQWESIWDDTYQHGKEPEFFWTKESQMLHTAKTPTFADGVDFWRVWPMETDLPAVNLNIGENGLEGGDFYGISFMTIPRHGSRPSSLSTNWPAKNRLPGAINMTFYDGHAAQVPLEQLWQQEWHQGWQTPVKRPGL
jgi:prepilin-type processing-associated H-X9-DG protein